MIFNAVDWSWSKSDWNSICFKSNVIVSLCTHWIHHGRRLFFACKSAIGNLDELDWEKETQADLSFYRMWRAQFDELTFKIVKDSLEFASSVVEFWVFWHALIKRSIRSRIEISKSICDAAKRMFISLNGRKAASRRDKPPFGFLFYFQIKSILIFKSNFAFRKLYFRLINIEI